jgi:hypothetical protein
MKNEKPDRGRDAQILAQPDRLLIGINEGAREFGERRSMITSADNIPGWIGISRP